jgi:hypothetical protein
MVTYSKNQKRMGRHGKNTIPFQSTMRSYQEEFSFRFNRHTFRGLGLIFRSLLERAIATGPIPENIVTKGYDGANWSGGANRIPAFIKY